MAKMKAVQVSRPGGDFEVVEREIPQPGPRQVRIRVIACGVCHSDIHLIDNDWGYGGFPLVPGHEILGRVIARGDSVKHLELGAVVGVGWQSSACLECEDCLNSRDNMCDHRAATCVGHPGGYADYHVTDSRFCFAMPEKLQTPAAAPLLCGGATVFNPISSLLNDGLARTGRIGIVGMGGLGHLAVKFARTLGLEVTLFSSSPSKRTEAEAMGIHHFVASNEKGAITSVGRKLDMVLVTANVDLPWSDYLKTIRSEGSLCFVGVPPSPLQFSINELMGHRVRVTASPIASRAQIHQMLDFCAVHGITADAEVYPMDQVNDVLEKVRSNRVHYRAVLKR
jgi:uncharacterized zinc-type alcohol dehydrogenase-like protein